MSGKIHTYADKNYSLELSIDWRDGSINISERHESHNASDMEVYYGWVAEYGLPDAITVRDWEALNEELKPLVERAVAGFEKRWDGNNMVGSFDDDASAAVEAIAELIENYRWDEVEVWGAEEWLNGCNICAYDIDGDRSPRDTVRYEIGDQTITWETTDEQLEAIEQALDSDEDERIVRGLRDYLEGLREECIKNYQEVEQEIIDAIYEDDDAPVPATLSTVRLYPGKPKSARESAESMVEALGHLPATVAAAPAKLYSYSELQAAMERAYSEGNPNLRISKSSGELIFTHCCWPRWMGDYWIGVNDQRLDRNNITAALWQLKHAGVVV